MRRAALGVEWLERRLHVGHVRMMRAPEPPLLDLTPEGEFRRPIRPPFSARVARWAILIAIAAGGLAAAMLAFWLFLILIPVAIAAGLIGYGALRFQHWRNSR